MPTIPTPNDSFLDDYARLKAQVAELARAIGQPGNIIRDSQGTALLSGGSTGAGLGRPYLPVTFTPFAVSVWPGTTSSTPAVLATATFYKQHSHILVPVWSSGSVAGTTGTLQLQVGGVTIGSPVTVTDPVTLTTLGPTPLPGAHLTQVSVNVLVARTGGTGTFSVDVGNAYSMAP